MIDGEWCKNISLIHILKRHGLFKGQGRSIEHIQFTQVFLLKIQVKLESYWNLIINPL